ncbi:MAG: branched-chain amino acid aminotransferase [Cyclobacteriaceae bacterium]|nr:MAG: branched-chain amino acid aminotransferase [Cyclobacteriaceae bacterium]
MNFNRNTTIFLNGKWLKASDNIGNLLGHSLPSANGVFDGLRAYGTETGTQIFKTVEHFTRLQRAASKMHIDLEYTCDELTEIAYQLLEKNNLHDAYIRALVYLNSNESTRTSKDIYLLITAWEWERHSGSDLLKVMISGNQGASRPSPVDTKLCGNYVSSVFATMEAKSKGFDEALMVDSEGYVTEGPGANFFYEKDEVLYTPPSDMVFPGITRATVMGYAREMGFKLVEKRFKAEELIEADMAFFTSTTAEITGIRSIGGHDFPMDWEDTVGYSLFLMYRQRVVNNEFRDFTLV